MKTDSIFPFDLHWDAQALADAVPLRLFEINTFDAPSDTRSHNDARAQRATPKRRRDSYVPRSMLPLLMRVC